MSLAGPFAINPRSWKPPHRRMLCAALGAWLLLGVTGAVGAEQPLGLEPSPGASRATGFAPVSPVRHVHVDAEAAWVGDPALRWVRLTLHGRVASGYYIYALADGGAPEAGASRIEVEGAEPGRAVASRPQRIHDAVFAGPRKVHQGTFRLSQEFMLRLQAAAGGTLHGALIYHVCDGRICSDERRLPFAVAIAGG